MSRPGLFPPPDLHHFNAAQGWLELGNFAEARHELEQISAQRASHPDVLELQWALCAHEKNWEEARKTAEQLVACAPERGSGWIDHAYSLHELKRTEEALEKLQSVVTKFPKISTIPYNLACYTCQLGRLDEARAWLAQAMRVGQRKQIVELALADLDLEPLWAELKGAI